MKVTVQDGILIVGVLALIIGGIVYSRKKENKPAIKETKTWVRSIQVITVDGDTATIEGGATCNIYVHKD